jgi:hypothetical protein
MWYNSIENKEITRSQRNSIALKIKKSPGLKGTATPKVGKQK